MKIHLRMFLAISMIFVARCEEKVEEEATLLIMGIGKLYDVAAARDDIFATILSKEFRTIKKNAPVDTLCLPFCTNDPDFAVVAKAAKEDYQIELELNQGGGTIVSKLLTKDNIQTYIEKTGKATEAGIKMAENLMTIVGHDELDIEDALVWEASLLAMAKEALKDDDAVTIDTAQNTIQLYATALTKLENLTTVEDKTFYFEMLHLYMSQPADSSTSITFADIERGVNVLFEVIEKYEQCPEKMKDLEDYLGLYLENVRKECSNYSVFGCGWNYIVEMQTIDTDKICGPGSDLLDEMSETLDDTDFSMDDSGSQGNTIDFGDFFFGYY